MRVIFAILVGLVTATAPAYAQESSTQTARFCEGGPRIAVRQNTKTKTDVAAPGFVTWTNPDGDDPIQAQAGIAAMVNCDLQAGLAFAPYVEYLRNDAASKPQDVVRAGGQLEWILFPEQGPPPEVSANATSTHHSGVIIANGDFKRDKVNATKSLVLSGRYTHFFNGAHRWRPNLPFTVWGDWLEVVYSPYVGLETERVFQSDLETREGSIGRFNWELRTLFYPAPAKLQGKVEFILAYAHRLDVWDSTDEEDDNHPYFTFDANVYPIKTESAAVGLGVGFKNGENPDEGYASQQLWFFGLKIRLQ